MRDHLTDDEIAVYGRVARLEIPLRSVMNLRKAADILHGLATQLDYLGRYRDQKPTITALEVRRAVRKAQDDLQRLRGRGRPRKQPIDINIL